MMSTERHIHRVLNMVQFGMTLEEIHDDMVGDEIDDLSEEQFHLVWHAAQMVAGWRD